MLWPWSCLKKSKQGFRPLALALFIQMITCTTTGTGIEAYYGYELFVRDKCRKMKGTGEAGTKRICLPFQFVADLKGGGCTTRTQTDGVSGAIIKLSGRLNIATIVKALVLSPYYVK